MRIERHDIACATPRRALWLASCVAGWLACAPAANAASMPAGHWVGPHITPKQYLESNKGLYELDAKGVLVTLYRDRAGQQAPRIEYNPAFIANYAITACREYVSTGKASAKQTLESQLHWLLGNGERRKAGERRFRRYPYGFEWVKYRLDAPWVSGFAQALIGTAFACGADATGSKDYSSAAAESFAALMVSTKEGGVTTFGRDGAWFEEAAKEDFPSMKILNGHLTAMEALKGFTDWKADAAFSSLHRRAVLATRALLASFDAGYLSYYDHFPPERPDEWNLSGRVGYNGLHVIQLTTLFEATRDPAFLSYALQFARYETPLIDVRASGSTAPDTNGPDRINMVLGNDYWSSNVFPARVEIDLGQVFKTQGISIVAHTPESTPRNFSISVSRDGREFREVSTETVNTAMRRTLRWSQRPGRYVRIDIRSDNGNLNVTLKGVYVHREEPLGAAVATARSMTINNMPGMAFSEAGWRAPAVGWLIFRRSAVPGGVQRARIAHAPSAQFTVKTGATLWRLLESRRHSTMTCTDNPCYVPIPRQSGDYVMLEWGGASADTRIVLDRHEPRPQLPGSFRAD